VFAQVRAEMRGRSLLLLEPGSLRAGEFERVFGLEQGRIVERSRHCRTAARETLEEAQLPHQGEVDIYELVAILTRIPLFSGIDRSRLKLLAFTSELAAFEAGETVFRQGDAGDRAYVIIEGAAEVIL